LEQIKQDLELKALECFCGTQEYHNVLGANVTDGVRYIMENGYSWFVTDSIVIIKMKPKLYREAGNFLQVKLTRTPETERAVITIDDGNEKILHTQKIEYTNAKRDLKLFFIDGVLMLAGEY
jgi:hypothetical protein